MVCETEERVPRLRTQVERNREERMKVMNEKGTGSIKGTDSIKGTSSIKGANTAVLGLERLKNATVAKAYSEK